MRVPSRDLTNVESFGVVCSLFNIFILPIISFQVLNILKIFENNLSRFCFACYFSWLPSNIIFIFTLFPYMSLIDLFMCFIYIQCVQIIFLLGLFYLFSNFLFKFGFFDNIMSIK